MNDVRSDEKMANSNDNETNYYRKKALDLLKQFTEEVLDGHIDKLKTYSFWGIDGDKNFGNGKSYPDADCTKIVYAINFLVYGNKIEEKTRQNFRLYGYTTEEALYSGETLNTFRTLFSSKEYTTERIEKLYDEKYGKGQFKIDIYNRNNRKEKNDASNDKKFFEIDSFYYVYQRIGNIPFLPCKTVCTSSINKWKGFDNEIKDYCYPFLEILKKTYEFKDSEPDINSNCWDLWHLMKRNSFFFDKDKIDSFDKYVKFFDLEGWESLKLDNYLRSSELTKDNIYIAKDYVDKATKFINNRSEEIVEKLKKFLENETDFPKGYLK